MFARIEVAMQPDLLDSAALGIVRRIELADPFLKRRIRWSRLLDVYWIDIPAAREELIPAIGQICWDRVLKWVFTGNLMPSAAGKTGGLEDLMQLAPNRPGKFWGIERRFRPGVTDNMARTLIEAFEIVLGRKLPQARASSGGLLLLEGPELNEESLATIARGIFCNELIETWTLVPEEGLKKNDRFHQERVKYDLPKVTLRGTDQVEKFRLNSLTDLELEGLSRRKLWALSLPEIKAIQSHFGEVEPTDVEMEVIAQTWSEHCKHKIFNAKIKYTEPEQNIEIDGLFKTTIAGTTAQIPKPWLLSVFSDNAGICAFDEEDAFCIKVETHNSPSALDPYGGALTGIVGVNRDILGCGLGAKPIFNTDVFCVAVPSYSGVMPDRLMHPRRILDGVRRGVEHGGNKSGIPTINGALLFHESYLGKPLIYCGTGGFMPRKSAGEPCEIKKILPGDRICMVGGRIGKDGIHGATFSSLALDESSPSAAVQLGDPLTQKRAADFLLAARDKGLYRAITDNGAGGLSSSVGELARLSGGAKMDVSLAKTKYPGLKPYELVISESQERMTVAVPPEKLAAFLSLAERWDVEVSDLGEFNSTGRFDIFYEQKSVASLDLKFLHEGVPQLELVAEWPKASSSLNSPASLNVTPDGTKSFAAFPSEGPKLLLDLLGRPNIASKEWLIRQYDHEVQGMSVVKPLHTVAPGTSAAWSGPNDAGVIQPKVSSDAGLAVGCGINPKLSAMDTYMMAQSAVDEAIRNVLCVGAEYGQPQSVMALVDNFCWPDPVGDSFKTAQLVRACFGLRDAALALSVPLISGKDSMKNDFRGMKEGKPITISVLPTLLMTAVAKVPDVKMVRTADFKSVGDSIYLVGLAEFGLLGSEFQDVCKEGGYRLSDLGTLNLGQPVWEVAQRVYSWLGRAHGKLQSKLKSVHDVSEGGLLVAIAECLIARGIGAKIQLPVDREGIEIWEFSFGEGFHSFIVTLSPEDAVALEAEWTELGVPFKNIGKVESHDRLEIHAPEPVFQVKIQDIRKAWLKEGYWE